MLPRAIASLRAQTMSAWICELHNDDPADPFPASLVQQLGDARIRLVTHERNLGPIATFNLFYHPTVEPFNLFYHPTVEPFFALLEDDNSWEPHFLERMIAALSAHPESILAWCNQSVTREDHVGEIVPTGHTVNAVETGAPRLIPWGDLRQVMGARHANGAMVMRPQLGKNYPTPEIPFGCVEAFRERMLPHPLVYVPETLATFTITQTTARRNDHVTWGIALVLLAATFLKHASLDESALRRLCDHFRQQSPPMTNELLAASFVAAENGSLRRHMNWRDWMRFLLQLARHPLVWWRILRARTLHPDWWEFLDYHTAARFASAPRPRV